MVTREEFNNFYKKEISTFQSNLISEKERIKSVLHAKFREEGYDEAVRHREMDLKKKV